MRTFTEIFLCMFAVYGIYSMILEICAFLSRKAHVVFAAKVGKKERRAQTEARLAALRSRAVRERRAHPDPVILCEEESVAESVRDIGYEIYIRYER